MDTAVNESLMVIASSCSIGSHRKPIWYCIIPICPTIFYVACRLWNAFTIATVGGFFRFAVYCPLLNNKGTSYAGNIPFVSAPTAYYAVTLGMNWKSVKWWSRGWTPIHNINIRKNIRYDRANGIDMEFCPFGGRKGYVLFSLDATISL